MPEPSPMEFRDIDLSPDDAAAVARLEDIASYATVRVTLGDDPDNPDIPMHTINIEPGAPCYLTIAAALRGIADEFERRHAITPRCQADEGRDR